MLLDPIQFKEIRPLSEASRYRTIPYLCLRPNQQNIVMKKFIAYYRVSTKEQGKSGLGLGAQRESVKRYIGSSNILVDEFQEVESGRKCDRIKLKEAIAKAKETESTLIIAKLDRLSRNARFIFTLRDSGVDFICADMPQANSLTIGLLSVLAEDEAKRTSERTVSSLGEIKRKISTGVKHVSKKGNVVTRLGSPENLTKEARIKGNEVKKQIALDNPESKKAGAFIISLKDTGGLSFPAIVQKLNESGFSAPKGGGFSTTQVMRLYNRYKQIKDERN